MTHLNRGNVFARLGFKEQAIRDYDTVDRLNPRLIASYGGTAKLLEEMGQAKPGGQERRLASKPNPAEAALAHECGNARRAEGDWQRAIADFSHVIALELNRCRCLRCAGLIALAPGEPGGENDARAYLQIEGYRTRVSPYMTFLGLPSARRAAKADECRPSWMTHLAERLLREQPGPGPP